MTAELLNHPVRYKEGSLLLLSVTKIDVRLVHSILSLLLWSVEAKIPLGRNSCGV